MKQKVIELQQDIEKPTIIFGNFNTSFQFNRRTRQQIYQPI